MKTLKFTIHISAPKEIVWKVLWSDDTYRSWTSAFVEGSYAVTDWSEGSEIRFMSPDGTGMCSTIAHKIPDRFMSFKHSGEYYGEAEHFRDKSSNLWANAYENYTLNETEGITELKVEVDTEEDHVDHFKDVFPKALKKIKELAESSRVYSAKI